MGTYYDSIKNKFVDSEDELTINRHRDITSCLSTKLPKAEPISIPEPIKIPVWQPIAAPISSPPVSKGRSYYLLDKDDDDKRRDDEIAQRVYNQSRANWR